MTADTRLWAKAICGGGLIALSALPAQAQPNAVDVATAPPALAPQPVVEPVLQWGLADAAALLAVIEGIEAEGLFPSDYRPDLLRAALAKGVGPALDEAASTSFGWLAEDLRDGRTPMTARVQWFAVDPDQDERPTAQLMAAALNSHDVAGVLASLAPAHADYAALKAELAATPPESRARRAIIRANMDRWRWLRRDLGDIYLLTNVPEFQLRLTVKGKNIRTYRTVVGKPGRTATPQLAETVTAVVFNPTWTVPQSIVKGEGLGARLLANPASARAQNYKVTKAKNGMITVVQQPGPGNALGLMKIDMPNPHAIYLHDTPSKQYFNHDVRAYSHGCIRTERAVELGMTMAILGAKMPAAEAAALSTAREYKKVPMTRTFPVYLTYFTMGTDINGALRQFGDIYGRDKPVIDSFAAPRQIKTTQRKSDEAIIKLDNPL
jgi:murein L,D-transpeptidase YcbB/YkuD